MTRHDFFFSLLLAGFATVAAVPFAHAAPASTQEDLRMVTDSASFREAADAFVARSMAGDVAGTLAMLSRQLVERSGEAK